MLILPKVKAQPSSNFFSPEEWPAAVHVPATFIFGIIMESVWFTGQAEEAIKDLNSKPAMSVPCGWEFYTADFSLKASMKSAHGSVMLVRDYANRRRWHKLTEEQKEVTPLYVSGAGPDLWSAIKNASEKAAAAGTEVLL